MSWLTKAWRRLVLGERSQEITVIEAADLKSFDPVLGAQFRVTKSHRETITSTRRQRRRAATARRAEPVGRGPVD